jgi:hypothetical protein
MTWQIGGFYYYKRSGEDDSQDAFIMSLNIQFIRVSSSNCDGIKSSGKIKEDSGEVKKEMFPRVPQISILALR